MPDLYCHACFKLLTGGLDTFGPPERPVCQACHLSGALSPAEEEAEKTLKIARVRAMIEDYEYQLYELDGEIGRTASLLKGLRAAKKRKEAVLKTYRDDLYNLS